MYIGEGEGTSDGPERLIAQSEAAGALHGHSVVTPDKNLAEILRAAGLSVTETIRPTSAAIAQLGWNKLQRGEVVSPVDLEANYIRRSDAEIFSKSSS